MAITIAFDAEPHPLPRYDNRPVTAESPLRRGAKGAIGYPEIDTGKDAPEGAPLVFGGGDHGSRRPLLGVLSQLPSRVRRATGLVER